MTIVTSRGRRFAGRPGSELHFFKDANSSVDCGGIHDNAVKLWLSFWFKLDSFYSSAATVDQYIIAKVVGGDLWESGLDQSNGRFRYRKFTGGGEDFTIVSAETSWVADVWNHVLMSISDVAGARFIINGGTAVTNADVSAAPGVGNLVLGDRAVGTTLGLVGELRDVVVGTDDLSTTEEMELFYGIIPADATDFWRLNEGYGTSVASLGSDATVGTVDSACTWEKGLRGRVFRKF